MMTSSLAMRSPNALFNCFEISLIVRTISSSTGGGVWLSVTSGGKAFGGGGITSAGGGSGMSMGGNSNTLRGFSLALGSATCLPSPRSKSPT